MAADHLGFVVKREQLGLDRTENLSVVTAGQVGPANRVVKERVARDQFVLVGKQQADASLGVPGRMQNIEIRTGHVEAISVSQTDIDRDRLWLWHAQPTGLGRESLDERVVGLVHINRRTGQRLEFSSSSNVVDVCMSYDNPLDGQPMPLQHRLDAIDFIARIDDDRLPRGFVAKDRAVALQRADGHHFVNHRWYASNVEVTVSEAFRRGAAWSDLSLRGRLRATGQDRTRLLHAISSNDIEGLSPGQGTYAFFLSAQGKIQADSYIFVDDDRVEIDCEPTAVDALRQHIEGYIIMDDVVLETVSSETARLGLAGPEAAGIVRAIGLPTPAGRLTFLWNGTTCVRRALVAGRDGFWIEVPAAEAPDLTNRLLSAGALNATAQECEATRVRMGVPRFGADFGPANIPHETQQFCAVSFTKGCYTGQEIVERVRSLGRVRRLLVGIELDSDSTPTETVVRHQGSAVGELTSATPGCGPADRARGFSIVRREAADAGTPIHVGDTPGVVIDVARH